MKRFLKMLAVAMALVLTVSAAGVNTAEAAAKKPKISSTGKTIYVGGSKVSTAKSSVVLTIGNRPKKYSVEWESSDPTIATVERYKGTSKYKGTVKAVNPGTCTITAKVLDKTSKTPTLSTLTCKITVKKNASKLAISPSTIDTMTEGDSKTLTATIYDEKGAAVTPGKEVTDIVRWATSDSTVASVSNDGVVTAHKAGTATIFAYTIQADTGKYSVIGYATAKDSVTVNVKSKEIPAIMSVKQKSLNSIEVVFGADYSKVIDEKNHIKLSAVTVSGTTSNAEISKVQFDSTGKIATITTKNELYNNGKYVLSTTVTGTSIGLSTEFVASAGVPVRMELYTDVNKNCVIAAEMSEIRFRLFDSNGVDITPTNRNSAEYATYAGRISCQTIVANNGNAMVNGRNIWIYDVNKSIDILGTYNDGKNPAITAVITVTAVTEASTMILDGFTVAKVTQNGASIDWAKPSFKLSKSDNPLDYKLVARVKTRTGAYIYSDTVGSKISFGFPAGHNPTCFFLGTSSVSPLNVGSDYVEVKYDNVVIGGSIIEIGPERVPVTMNLKVDGEIPTTIIYSDSFVTNPTLGISVLDSYGENYTNITAGNFTITCNDVSGPYAHVTSVNSDGEAQVEINPLGYGITGGKGYTYKVKFTNGTQTLESAFAILVIKPDASAPSNYRLTVKGDTDLKVTTSDDLNKSISFTLVEYKGSVRYMDAPLRTSKEACGIGEYYVVVKDSANKDVTLTTGVGGKVEFRTVYTTSTTISKAAAGDYMYIIYKRGTTTDTPIQSGKITLKDSQAGARFEVKSTTTDLPIRANMTQTEQDLIFNQCFSVYVGSDSAVAASVATATVVDKGIFFRTVNVLGSISIGGTSYSISYTIPVNVAVTNK